MLMGALSSSCLVTTTLHCKRNHAPPPFRRLQSLQSRSGGLALSLRQHMHCVDRTAPERPDGGRAPLGCVRHDLLRSGIVAPPDGYDVRGNALCLLVHDDFGEVCLHSVAQSRTSGRAWTMTALRRGRESPARVVRHVGEARGGPGRVIRLQGAPRYRLRPGRR